MNLTIIFRGENGVLATAIDYYAVVAGRIGDGEDWGLTIYFANREFATTTFSIRGRKGVIERLKRHLSIVNDVIVVDIPPKREWQSLGIKEIDSDDTILLALIQGDGENEED